MMWEAPAIRSRDGSSLITSVTALSWRRTSHAGNKPIKINQFNL